MEPLRTRDGTRPGNMRGTVVSSPLASADDTSSFRCHGPIQCPTTSPQLCPVSLNVYFDSPREKFGLLGVMHSDLHNCTYQLSAVPIAGETAHRLRSCLILYLRLGAAAGGCPACQHGSPTGSSTAPSRAVVTRPCRGGKERINTFVF